MNPAFCLLAAAMVAAALALLLPPLLRGGRRPRPSRGMVALAFGVAVAMLLAAAGLYRLVGTPAALDGALPRVDEARARAVPVEPRQRDTHASMATARAAEQAGRGGDAREACGQVLRLDPRDTAAMVGWVEADMARHADYAIDAPARRLLEQAIALEPDNQRALWLLGISRFQRRDYAGASAMWKRLRPLLDAGSDLERSVLRQIAIADARARMPRP